MKRALLLLFFVFALAQPVAFAAQAETAPPPGSSAPPPTTAASGANAQTQEATTKAAAADYVQRTEPRTPDFLEYLVDGILERFDVRTGENTTSHFVISVLILV